MRKCEICQKKDNRICYYKKCNKYLCDKHYIQFKRNGKFLKRTQFDKNNILISGKYCEMDLYNWRNELIATTVFDKKYLLEVKKYKWNLSNGYVRNVKSKISLHELIMKKRVGYEIDHIDRNPLNNKNNNLRMVTRSQNNMNRSIQKNNISGIVGIGWYYNRWVTSIKRNNKSIYLGRFKNLKDAISVRQKAEKEYFGEYKKKPLVCLTWGVWDFMHVGHKRLFKKAKKYCDILVVCVSKNDYIKTRKKELPFYSFKERVNMIESLGMVDVISSQSLKFGKKEAIKKFKPSLLVVGNDHVDDYEGKGLGIPIIYIKYTKNISSTILRKKNKCNNAIKEE